MGNGRKKRRGEESGGSWLTTYSDMVTLLLTFFVMMLTTSKIDTSQLRLVMAYFNGMGHYSGGNTLSVGRLSELGNSFETFPSTEKGSSLNKSREKAVSEFVPEIQSKQVRIQMDERGLVITLAADSFFYKGSARVEIEKTRKTLQKMSSLLQGMPDKRFRIEGHTDDTPVDPDSRWETNWDLSTARATNVLHYLLDYSADPDTFEQQFQVSGFADTRPYQTSGELEGFELEEARMLNRRVDIIILTDGLL